MADIRPIDDSSFPPDGPPVPIDDRETSTNINDFKIQEQQQQQYYDMPYQYQPDEPKKTDIFGDMSKTTYIILFVAFILGFFMGKTMQPVILRPS